MHTMTHQSLLITFDVFKYSEEKGKENSPTAY